VRAKQLNRKPITVFRSGAFSNEDAVSLCVTIGLLMLAVALQRGTRSDRTVYEYLRQTNR
jgi:hypothetical protein